MYHRARRQAANKSYRIGLNILARAMRALMRANGSEGYFCIGAEDAYYHWNGLRLTYHFSEFGVAGNIDAGGNTETETIDKLTQMLTGDVVFYDVGAHEGLYALSMKNRFPSSTIYAFEPNAKALRANLNLNDANDIKLYECAIGDQKKTVTMTVGYRSSNFIATDRHAGSQTKMTTIDKLVASQSLKLPTAIKIDIEGFEFQALKGALRTLSSSYPIIVTEINDCFYRYHRNLSPWRNFMSELGYRLYSLKEGRLERVPDDILAIDKLPWSADANYWWLQRQG
jgi:FkbM family methyltransferase